MHVDEARGLLANLLNKGLDFVLAALGYTPANKAGDTFTGNVSVSPAAGNAQFTVRTVALGTAYVSIAGNGNTPLASSFDLIQDNSFAYIYQRANLPISVGVNNAEVCQFRTTGLAVSALGKGLLVKEGANAKMGTAVLVAGAVIVNTTAVTANSRIFLTAQTTGAGPGTLRVSAIVAGTSFTITSSSVTDTSTVAWIIFEPS